MSSQGRYGEWRGAKWFWAPTVVSGKSNSHDHVLTSLAGTEAASLCNTLHVLGSHGYTRWGTPARTGFLWWDWTSYFYLGSGSRSECTRCWARLFHIPSSCSPDSQEQMEAAGHSWPSQVSTLCLICYWIPDSCSPLFKGFHRLHENKVALVPSLPPTFWTALAERNT